MQIFRFDPDDEVRRIETSVLDSDAQALHWIDIERNEHSRLDGIEALLACPIHDRHRLDLRNQEHPPSTNAAKSYELIIVRSLDVASPPEAPATRSVAFVVTPHRILSVRPAGDTIFEPLKTLWDNGQLESPKSIANLLYLLLDQIADALLARREITSELLSSWQDRLLNPDDSFNDWQALMRLRRQLRRLEVTSELQIEAIAGWRENTSFEIAPSVATKFDDLEEHLGRLYSHFLVTQHDIDGLIQVFFSANTQRTNDTLRVLAIISAVFLPLNFVASVFGTNFTYLPWISRAFGPAIMIFLMAVLVLGLLVWFRKRKWL